MSGLKCFIIIPRDDSSDHAIVPIDYVNGGVQPGKLSIFHNHFTWAEISLRPSLMSTL